MPMYRVAIAEVVCLINHYEVEADDDEEAGAKALAEAKKDQPFHASTKVEGDLELIETEEI